MGKTKIIFRFLFGFQVLHFALYFSFLSQGPFMRPHCHLISFLKAAPSLGAWFTNDFPFFFCIPFPRSRCLYPLLSPTSSPFLSSTSLTAAPLPPAPLPRPSTLFLFDYSNCVLTLESADPRLTIFCSNHEPQANKK